MSRVAIVGGGISGLSLAARLAEAGLEPMVFEAAATVGGKIATRQKDGFLLETGPNGFLGKEPRTFELADRIGVGGQLRQAEAASGKRWIYLRDRLREVPTSPPAFLRSDLLPLSAKLRVAGELFTRRAPPGLEESVGDFGRRHLGRRATRDLLGAMVLGIFGGDVDKLSLPSAFPRMAELDREHRSLILAMIRLQKARKALPPGPGGGGGPAGPSGALMSCEGGLGHYVQALAASLGETVQTGVSVRSVEKDDAGWTLHVDDRGTAREVRADHLVVTTPGNEQKRLLAPLDPALADLAGGIPYAPIAVVHLGWKRENVAHPLDGFGFLVPPHEDRKILGVMFISSIFPWRAPEGQVLLTAMVGGAIRPDLARLPEAEVAAIAREEVASIVGARGEPSLVEVVRWDHAIPQYVVGHGSRLKEAEARASALGLHLGGNAWRGVGFNDCIADASLLAERIVHQR